MKSSIFLYLMLLKGRPRCFVSRYIWHTTHVHGCEHVEVTFVGQMWSATNFPWVVRWNSSVILARQHIISRHQNLFVDHDLLNTHNECNEGKSRQNGVEMKDPTLLLVSNMSMTRISVRHHITWIKLDHFFLSLTPKRTCNCSFFSLYANSKKRIESNRRRHT